MLKQQTRVLEALDLREPRSLTERYVQPSGGPVHRERKIERRLVVLILKGTTRGGDRHQGSALAASPVHQGAVVNEKLEDLGCCAQLDRHQHGKLSESMARLLLSCRPAARDALLPHCRRSWRSEVGIRRKVAELVVEYKICILHVA